MAEDLPFLVVRREEAQHIAMPRPAIEVAFIVKDHILGAFNLAQADQFDIGQLVVVGVGRCRVVHLQRRQGEIGGRDIDLGQNLQPVLQPFHVDRHRHQQQQTQNQRIGPRPQAKPQQRALDHDHDQRAQKPLGDRPAPAAKADPAQNRRRQGRHFQPDAGIGARSPQPCRIKQPGGSGERARNHIGQEHGLADRNPGIVGRASRSADRLNAPADAKPGQHHMGQNAQDHCAEKAEGQAQNTAFANEIPGFGGAGRAGHHHLIFQNQRVECGAHHDQGDKRGQKRPQAQVTDQESIQGTDQGPYRQRRQNDHRQRQHQGVEHRQRAECRQRKG